MKLRARLAYIVARVSERGDREEGRELGGEAMMDRFIKRAVKGKLEGGRWVSVRLSLLAAACDHDDDDDAGWLEGTRWKKNW